jgi:hypothetical protein
MAVGKFMKHHCGGVVLAVQMLVIIGSLPLSFPSGATEGGRATILIHDVYELQNMSLNLDGDYELANDIDASGTSTWNGGQGFLPVGSASSPFKGALDGLGHSIYRLFIALNLTDIGLFGVTDSTATISNTRLERANLTGIRCVGGLAGRNNGSVSSCNVTDYSFFANPPDDEYNYAIAGGLAGENNGKITGCFAHGTVTTTFGEKAGPMCPFGGIAGLNHGFMQDCANLGIISGGNSTGGIVGNSTSPGRISRCSNGGSVNGLDVVGGIVGSGHGYLDNCSNAGNVSGRWQVGGIAGQGGHIVDSENSGNVSGTNSTGGIMGTNWKGRIIRCRNTGTVAGQNMAGGIVGGNYGLTFRCYSEGYVFGTSEVGGLAGRCDNDYGWEGMIYDSYSISTVEGTDCVGGLVGILSFLGGSNAFGEFWGGNISNCYSAGNVTGAGKTGGLVGESLGGLATACYWDTETSGWNTSICGTGKTTVEMKKQATFVGWDFDTVWDIVEDQTYPRLQILDELQPPSVAIHMPDQKMTPIIDASQFQGSGNDTEMYLIEGIAQDHPGNTMPKITRIDAKIGENGTWMPAEFQMTSQNYYRWNYTWDIYNWSLERLGAYPSKIIPCPISVRAFNGFQWGADSANITVTFGFPPQHHKPAWSSVPSNTSLEEGSTYRFTAAATDDDPAARLVFGLSTSPACGLSINASTGAMEWLDASAGEYKCVLNATDGYTVISHQFGLSVTKKPAVQPAIVAVSGPDNVTVKASSVQTFSVEASSPTNATLTYEWKDNGVTVSTERTFSRKFSPGDHVLILLIGDGRYTTSRTFNFTVARPPKTIDTKPISLPGFEAGIAAAAVVVVVSLGLFWRRERR